MPDEKHLISSVQLKSLLSAETKNDKELYNLIVNTPFKFKVETTLMFLGIVVLLIVNKDTGYIDRVALSDTELATNTTDVSVLPFKQIKIPLDYRENIISEAILTGTPQDTIDWKFLFNPALKPEAARINQASAGIAYSAVYPLNARQGGALIFSYFQYSSEIGVPQKDFMKTFSRLVDKRLS